MNADKIISCANYYVDNHSTIRKVAKTFKVSKTWIHEAFRRDLKYISPALYMDVMSQIKLNTAMRHLRGGQATRLKFLRLSRKR